MKSIKERIIEKILKSPTNCWVWQGAVFKKKYGDYAQLRTGKKVRKAHQLSYEVFVGTIPKGKELDHLCHNTLCVNPLHLEPVTHAENMKRRKDSNLSHCKYGHPYSIWTTYFRPDNGRRECKTCRKLKVQKFHQHIRINI